MKQVGQRKPSASTDTPASSAKTLLLACDTVLLLMDEVSLVSPSLTYDNFHGKYPTKQTCFQQIRTLKSPQLFKCQTYLCDPVDQISNVEHTG